MKSTIQDELNDQQRDSLADEMVKLMTECPGGDGQHKWRLMQWERRNDIRPLYSAYSMTPILHEAGPSTTSAKMVCFCGTSVDVKRTR